MLGRVIETRLASVQELVRVRLGTDGSPAEGPIPRSALEDLAHALEALRAAEQELQRKNRELAASRQFVEERWRRYEDLLDQAASGESEARFQAIFDHAFSAILVLDDDGRIVEANPAALSVTGFARKQLLGRRLSDLFSEEPGGPAEAHGIARLRRADGALRSLDLTSHRGIAPGRHLIFAQDVTALEAVTADRDLLRALASHRFEAQEEASRRIARELHDETGEVLTSIHLRLDQLTSTLPAARRRVREVRSLLDEMEQRLRRISHELRPIILDDLGLVSALEHLVEGAASRTKTTIDMEGGAVGRLPPAVETVLYRIAQEALVNALRHAQAKRVHIRVWRDGSEVTLSVEDDGVGFDPQTCCQRGKGARPSGLGLVGIRERAESVGGVLTVRSAPGQGLEVRVRVPV